MTTDSTRTRPTRLA